MVKAEIDSKTLCGKTNISRATLNNYISYGLIPRPRIATPRDDVSQARRLGYFPFSAVERVSQVQQLKKQGLSMSDIVGRLGHATADSPLDAAVAPGQAGTDRAAQAGSAGDDGELRLTVETIPYPAYMVNPNLEVTWLNRRAAGLALGDGAPLPDSSHERNLFALLWRGRWSRSAASRADLLSFHLALAKDRLTRSALDAMGRRLGAEAAAELAGQYERTRAQPPQPVTEATLRLGGAGGEGTVFRVYATRYREGTLFVFIPGGDDAGELIEFLSRRDDVIRALVRNRLPVLMPLAVLVADLQNSVRICSELPPEEYFALINEIRSAMDPLFRRYYGTHGKHAGDGMVHYFFPQPDCSYIDNALACAWGLKREMARISREWRARKGWPTDLCLNIGLDEGEEWLGTFQTPTNLEVTVLGETINHAARLSDLARHGAVWATKNLISRLGAESRARIRYGLRHRGADGAEYVVESTYARVVDLIERDTPKADKLHDIGALTVAELIELRD